jgi:iron complex outermembrane receptor protein
MKFTNQTLCAISCLPGIVFLSNFANAEAEKPVNADVRFEEVIVTGSKRETDLIDSDLSVTTIDATMIDQMRIRDFDRIDDIAPNVQFNESGQRGSIYITVRGVESNPFIINRAAVYIDGIPFRELSNSVLNQIESIEVLRGPQGTLYGANTESGLIIVNTKAPTSEPSGSLRLTATDFSSGHGIEADGHVSGSLIDNTLAGSLAFNVAKEDAYVKNLDATDGEAGQIKDNFLQGRLRWTPNERLTVNMTTYWLDMDAPGIFDQQYVPLNLDLYNQNYSAFFNGGREADEWTAFEDAPKHTTEEEFVIGLSATYELNYGKLDFAYSYRDLEEDAKGLDFDFTASPIVAGSEKEVEEYKNVEVRFTSPADDVFEYIVGLAYYEDSEERTLSSFVGPGTIDSYNAAPAQQKSGEDTSAFGSINWYATPDLKLGMGLRYEKADRSTRQVAGELDLGFGSVISYQDAQLSESFEELLPRISALYKFSENFSIHASIAKGYIPGGFNLAAIQDGVDDENILTYDSETLLSREVGFKWLSENRNLRVTGAAFYITSDNWQEIQIATDDTGRPVSSDYIGSDASIRSQGVELEANWQVTNNFSVDSHIGYVDAEYKDLQLNETLNVKGQPVQFVPEYDGGLSLRYEWAGGFFTRAEVNFTGEMPLNASGEAVRQSATTYGLEFGYETEQFQIRAFGENLTDERLASGLAIQNLAFGDDGLYYAPLDAPRIIGVELSFNFQ